MDAVSIGVLAGILSAFALFISVLAWADVETAPMRRKSREAREESILQQRELWLEPDAPALQLLYLMKDLGLDLTLIASENPAKFAEMLESCSTCNRHGRCGRDLLRHPLKHGWRSYCPNARAIQDLLLRSERVSVYQSE